MKQVLVDYQNQLSRHRCNDLSGGEGFCYHFRRDMYKIYYEKKDLDDVCDLTPYMSNLIAFPKAYLVNKEHIGDVVGEIMDLIPKDPLIKSINGTTNLNLFKKYYNELLVELRKFPEIFMLDMVDCNILYDDITGFSLIDTTGWQLSPGDNISINEYSFSRSLAHIVIGRMLKLYEKDYYNSNFRNSLKKYGVAGNELFMLFECLFQLKEIYLIEIIEAYEYLNKKVGNAPLINFSDVQKYTKILKKG